MTNRRIYTKGFQRVLELANKAERSMEMITDQVMALLQTNPERAFEFLRDDEIREKFMEDIGQDSVVIGEQRAEIEWLKKNPVVCPVCDRSEYIERHGMGFIDGKVHLKFFCWCDTSFSWVFDDRGKVDVVLDHETLLHLYLRTHPEEHKHVHLTNVNGIPQRTLHGELWERQMLWTLEQGYITQEQYDYALENQF